MLQLRAVASGPGFEPQLGPIFFFLSTFVVYSVFKSSRICPPGIPQEFVKNKGPSLLRNTIVRRQFVPVTRPWTAGDSRATFPSMVLTVPKDDYKHSKEAFVSGMTGSTVSHVNMIALVALVCLHPLLSRGIC